MQQADQASSLRVFETCDDFHDMRSSFGLHGHVAARDLVLS
jgi:hypothetical protein